MEKTYSASDARNELAELLDRTNYKGERIVIQKNGKNVSVLVGYQDYLFMQKLENNYDLRDGKEADTTQKVSLKKLQQRRGTNSSNYRTG